MSETASLPRLHVPCWPSIEALSVVRPVVEFVRAVNAGDLEVAVAQLAPDAVHRTSSASYPPEAVRAMLGRLRAVFPDLLMEIRDQQVTGRTVVSRIVATGTHRGSFLGRPASGEWVSWESMDVAEVGPVDMDRAKAGRAKAGRAKAGRAEADALGAGDAPATGRHRVLVRHWSLWNAPELFGRLGFVPGRTD